MRKWIDNSQEKDEKIWRYGKRLFKNFFFSLIKFCTCLVAMKVDLLLAIFFASLLGMLIGLHKRAGLRHAIDDEEYEILKQLATVKFVKP